MRLRSLGVDGGVSGTDCFAQAGAEPGLGVVAVDISNPRSRAASASRHVLG